MIFDQYAGDKKRKRKNAKGQTITLKVVTIHKEAELANKPRLFRFINFQYQNIS